MTRLVRGLVVWLVLVLVGGQALRAAGVSQTSEALDIEAVEAYIEAQMRRHRLPGVALAITQGAEIAYLGGFGSAGGGQSVTPQTPFFIASVSKSFTALAVMQLVDAGLVELDAPVQRYIPWFVVADPEASGAITVRHLLHQISGLSGGGFRQPLPTPGMTMAQTVRQLSEAELTAVPGTTHQYFNPNYTVLGLIIEEVTGRSYADYVHESIFSPLEMTRSFTAPEPAEGAGLATGHNPVFGYPVPRRQPFFAYDLPAGFIISTAEDMAHYLIAQNNSGRFDQTVVVSSEAVTAMHTPAEGVESNYAMGWNLVKREDVTIVRHNGSLDTFYADAILLPEREIGIALLVNQNGLLPLLLAYEPLSDGLIDVVLAQEPASGPSMRVLHGIVTVIIVADLVRHGFVMSRLDDWQERVLGMPRARKFLDVAWQHLLFPMLLAALIAIMILSADLNAVRLISLYFAPDISLWLAVSAMLFLLEGGVKLKRILNGNRDSTSPTGSHSLTKEM